MRQRVSFARSGSQERVLAITADATATVGDVASALSQSDPLAPPGLIYSQPTLRVHDTREQGGRTLDPAALLHEAGVRSGARLELEEAGGRFARVGASGEASAAVVRILTGPQAGQEFGVPAGTSYIGRAHDCDVQLVDPLVSGRHARLVVGAQIELTDLQSVNGLVIGGQQVSRVALGPSDQVLLGDTLISVVALSQAQAVAMGPVVAFNRSPRVVRQFGEHKIPAPKPPGQPKPTRLPWLAMLAPLLMGGIMFALTRELMSVVFIALSPLIMVSTFLDQFIEKRSSSKAQRKVFEEAVEIAREAIRRTHSVERAVRASRCPTAGEAAGAITQLEGLLWTKRPEDPDFLAVRLGMGPSPSKCTIDIPNANETDRYSWNTLNQLKSECELLTDGPVIANLRESGSLGVAGPSPAAADVARGIALQLAAFQAPSELTFAALMSKSSRVGWEWLEWLPHTDARHSPLGASDHLADNQASAAGLLARLADLVDSRSKTSTKGSKEGGESGPKPRGPVDPKDSAAAQPPRLPAVVVLVADDAPVDRARLTSLAERGPDVGVHILWLATRTEALPAACRTFVIASDAPDSAYHGVTPGSVGEIRATAGQVRFGLHTYPLVCEGVGAHDCEGLARRLAPVIDAGALVDDDSDLPRALSYLTLAGHELAESPAHVAERWQQTFSINNREPGVPRLRRKPGGLSALVGQSAAGQFNLDLRLEGPHALVGGTTGAGKSEFLQAWVMGLATKYSPDRVTFLFIDYKGGSAFADCVQLPHCVGLVTDLSPHLVRRALTSLRAEIAHREHLLNRKKAKDLVSLEREGDPDTPPSLLIIVDEFAALVQEVPEFVDGVIDVAQRGRSLGLHLILATQRPAGVIKDNLRANTNLRIALRMADADDSSDVLGDPMAAHFDQSIPGRAAAKTGPGRIAQFQTGYVGGWTDATPEPARVDIDQLDFGVAATWERAEDPAASARAVADPGPNDIGRMVTTIGEAFDGCGLPLPRKPWLEPLAPVYDLARLQGYRDDAHLLLGVMDDPKAQDQPVVHYEPDRDGNLAILGAGGSGKSTALRTIALSAALSTRHGGPTHVYGLDFSSGGLKMLEPLPHVGAIIQGDDEERVIRLLRTLKGVVDERVTRYAQANAATIGEYRAATGQADEPRILLLIDGMANFREEYEYSSRSAWFTTFAQIAADGRPLGVHIVMTGDRAAAIPASIAATVQRQIVLRLASEDDYVALSAPKDVLGAASPPGRGVIGSNELQFAVLGADSNVAVQARAIEAVAETARRRGGTRAAPILRLPDKVPLEALPIRDARAWPTIGLADLDLAPIGIEPVGSLMLAGPAQSGRTTALLTIAIAVERANSTNHAMDLALIAPRKSVLESALSWQVVANGEDEAQALADEMIARFASESRPGRYGVFIDSVGDFTGTAAEDPLDRMVRAAVRSQQLVVGESESSTWSEAWTIAKPFKAGRRGLVLGSGESDADGLLGVSVGRTRAVDFPPGRGFLITGGRFQKVQIATVT